MGDLGDVEQFMKSLHITIPPSEPITLDWMKSRLEMINGQLKQTHTKEASLKNEIVTERYFPFLSLEQVSLTDSAC